MSLFFRARRHLRGPARHRRSQRHHCRITEEIEKFGSTVGTVLYQIEINLSSCFECL